LFKNKFLKKLFDYLYGKKEERFSEKRTKISLG